MDDARVDASVDPRGPIDVQINSPGREGLTGTAPASMYAPTFERDEITIPPDFRRPKRSRRGDRIFRSTGRRISTSSAATS